MIDTRNSVVQLNDIKSQVIYETSSQRRGILIKWNTLTYGCRIRSLVNEHQTKTVVR